MQVFSILLLAALGLGGDQSDSRPTGGVAASARVSVAQAAEAILEYVFASEPQMNRKIELVAKEITPDLAWKRMGIQVFEATEGHLSGRCYVIDRGVVTGMNPSFASPGLESCVVVDLDGNGAWELAYTYTFGSGMLYGGLAIYESVQQRRGIDAAAASGEAFVVPIQLSGEVMKVLHPKEDSEKGKAQRVQIRAEKPFGDDGDDVVRKGTLHIVATPERSPQKPPQHPRPSFQVEVLWKE